MKTNTSLLILAGLIFGFVHGLFWRFNTIISIDNFYYDFVLSWVIPLIIGVVIFALDKNTIKKRVLNGIAFWLLASVMYFVTTWIIFPIRFV